MPKINVDWNKCHECGACVTAVLPWFMSFMTFQIRDCDFETLRLMLEKMVMGSVQIEGRNR